MRVLIYGFSGKILGGIETFILNMNDYMSSDCIFDYIIDGNQCIYKERITQRGGNVFFLIPIRRNPFAYMCDMWRTLNNCRKAETKLFYVQLFSMANIFPVLLAKLCGYTVILHAHNNGLQSKSVGYKFLHLFGKGLLSLGNYIRFTNSELSKEFMFGKRIKAEIIYNAIDVDKFRFESEIRISIRESLNALDKTIVGFVGRLTPEKNPIFMLRVFAETLKLQPNSQLWIIGEGELRREMEQEAIELGITKNILWLARRNDVAELMQGMDVLLQPSLFEGLGIVLVEAQATGLHCLTSADVVPQEARTTHLLEYVSLRKNPGEWAKAIVSAAQNRIDRVSENDIVKEGHYNINGEAKRLERLLFKYMSK